MNQRQIIWRLEEELRSQFDVWLSEVEKEDYKFQDSSKAVIIISPYIILAILSQVNGVRHAGYRFSGPTAAYSFYQIFIHKKNLRKVIVMGPSHRSYLRPSIQTSSFDTYDTPLGPISVQKMENTAGLKKEVELAEHSLELQMPFLKHVLDRRAQAGLDPDGVQILPLLVCDPSSGDIDTYSDFIYSMLTEGHGDTLLLVSSDFCHWGKSFGYCPSLKEYSATEPLHERIKFLDAAAMTAIEQGKSTFEAYLMDTGNTVCGRNPIRIALAVCQKFKSGEWRWLHYDQSGNIIDPNSPSSQVSYVASVFKMED